jgi:hypothetical protein
MCVDARIARHPAAWHTCSKADSTWVRMGKLAILQWSGVKREVHFVGYNREHTACFIRDEQNARRAITLYLVKVVNSSRSMLRSSSALFASPGGKAAIWSTVPSRELSGGDASGSVHPGGVWKVSGRPLAQAGICAESRPSTDRARISWRSRLPSSAGRRTPLFPAG